MDRLLEEYAKAKNHEHEPTSKVGRKSPGAFVAEVEKHVAKQWPADKGKVRAVYAMLSDICHPSLGGDLFFAEIPQRPGGSATVPSRTTR